MKKIGIAFSIYNKIDFTKNCLSSIYDNMSTNNLFIVIVDNGSTDGSYDIIKDLFPEVFIIKNQTNMGCSFSWNQGKEQRRFSNRNVVTLLDFFRVETLRTKIND